MTIAPKEEYLDPQDREWLESLLENEKLNIELPGSEALKDLIEATLACNPDDIVEAYIMGEYFFGAYRNVPDVRRALLIAFGVGEKMGDPDCTCNMGIMYYSADPDAGGDYVKAAQYYERAAKLGSSQGAVNLGYCYYYGRAGERDFAKAFQCYTLGYILDGNPEAAWKLADMFYYGKFVEKNEHAAYNLYLEAYDASRHTHACARPAHHIADILMVGIEGIIDPDPKTALGYYVNAEINYYDEIDSGLVYYKKYLAQVIDGQARAREAIEAERERGDLIRE